MKQKQEELAKKLEVIEEESIKKLEVLEK